MLTPSCQCRAKLLKLFSANTSIEEFFQGIFQSLLFFAIVIKTANYCVSVSNVHVQNCVERVKVTVNELNQLSQPNQGL